MTKVTFGGRQAIKLCQMSQKDRLKFLAEGLPIIAESAESFWSASRQLQDKPREMEVLENFAHEEAAKALILIDAVRCPAKLISSKLNKVVGHFYDHLARLIYAEAQHWKPMDMKQLREYVDQERRAHYLEGYAGEYILPNSTVARRESVLYADIEAYENGVLVWNIPHSIPHQFGFELRPTVLDAVDALLAVGAFTEAGLKIVSEVWGQAEFKESEDHQDAQKLTELMLKRLIEADLPLERAGQKHVSALYHSWQMPMYNLEFKLIDVPLEELQSEREAMARSEYGYDP
jgi:hypothetical protein